jgi:hypothetical protein
MRIARFRSGHVRKNLWIITIYETKILPLITFSLVWFALLPQTEAVNPPPDGGYPGFNTAEGTNALKNLTTGAANTAVGWYSLFTNTEGSFNTAVGAGALVLNVGNQTVGEGLENTAVGTAALLFNSTGSSNTAVGSTALENNITGDFNTANGVQALANNTEGGLNTADGWRALRMNISGNNNTATGVGALDSNTEGDDNTAVGTNALLFNISGDNNTALGRSAGLDINGRGNVCIGQGISGEAGVDDGTYIRNVNTTEQSPDEGVAFVTVRLSDSRIGHQPIVMRSASSVAKDSSGTEIDSGQTGSDHRPARECDGDFHRAAQRAGGADTKSERAVGTEQRCSETHSASLLGRISGFLL